jgi:two-component sensor histidine kinase
MTRIISSPCATTMGSSLRIQLHLRWTESGGPAVQEPTRKGYGRRIIEQMIDQLKGKTRSDWRAEGLVCEITLRV